MDGSCVLQGYNQITCDSFNKQKMASLYTHKLKAPTQSPYKGFPNCLLERKLSDASTISHQVCAYVP